jgi:hypothetical protein
MLWLIWRCCALVSAYDGAVESKGRAAEGMAELLAVERA